MNYRKVASLLLFVTTTLNAHTISDKLKEAQRYEDRNGEDLISLLDRVNLEEKEIKRELSNKYQQAAKLSKEGASEEEFKVLLSEINELKKHLSTLEEDWREESIQASTEKGDAYAFWDQQETTLSQLIMEYGATDYLYVIPQELLALKLQVHSAIPIPRESWKDMLEIILSQNGIGVKKLNPYARQLYLLKHDLSAVQNIASKKEDLKWVPSAARVFYVLAPVPDQVRNVYSFLERFSDAKQTFIYQVGDKIALVSQKEEIEKLLSLYEAIWHEATEKTSKVVPLSKTSAKEMEKILKNLFLLL